MATTQNEMEVVPESTSVEINEAVTVDGSVEINEAVTIEGGECYTKNYKNFVVGKVKT